MDYDKRWLTKCPKCEREDALVESSSSFDGEVTVETITCFCGFADGDAS